MKDQYLKMRGEIKTVANNKPPFYFANYKKRQGHWNDAETQFMFSLLSEGWLVRNISLVMGRSIQSICSRKYYVETIMQKPCS